MKLNVKNKRIIEANLGSKSMVLVINNFTPTLSRELREKADYVGLSNGRKIVPIKSRNTTV